MLNLYRATAFLSAALLFMAQPMFARQVLPLVGGAPAVWNTCQVFFQLALLVGYLYAHFSTQSLGTRRQAVLHLLLILPPLLCLPLTIGNSLAPNPESNPSPWLLSLMLGTVGPPFLALSATAPLVQRWFVIARKSAAQDPYSLYVMSNCGSLAALIAYPFLIEPNSTLRTQTVAWAAGYGVWICCLAGCAYFVWLGKETVVPIAEPIEPPVHVESSKKKGKRAAQHEAAVTAPIVPTRALRWHWLALAGVPVAWMLGATTWITTDIAPVPLLWIAPLAIYLITYIIAFSARGEIALHWSVRIFPWTMCALVASLTAMGIWPLILVHLAAFAVGAMVCHGQLARLRPTTAHLTEFYVWLSVGGALGGTFVALVAPLVFVVPWEYPLAVAAGFALCPTREERPNKLVDLICVLAVLALLALLRQYAVIAQKQILLTAALCGFPVLAGLHFWRKPLAFAAVLGVILAIDVYEPQGGADTIRTARSYFGVHRVAERLDAAGRTVHELQHGTTAHGIQFYGADQQCEPLMYYHRTGPLGEIMRAFAPHAGAVQHVAAIGLGSGAAACYTGPERDITFFEIDPVVQELAESPAYFTYLSHCAKGRYTIRLGDGRRMLSLEPEARYEIILLDAFSSDAIPVHLITREALDVYMSRLAPHGILAFHVSNNHLNLAPVLVDLAHKAGWAVRVREELVGRPEELNEPMIPIERLRELITFKASSTYVVIARNREDLRGLAQDARWMELRPSGRAVWTDDYSNVLSVLKHAE